MKSFQYFQPTEIRFGRGRFAELGSVAARFGHRALLVSVPEEPCFQGLFTRAKAHLAKAGLAVTRFDEVIPNPTTDVVAMGALAARRFRADVVVAVGGGSGITCSSGRRSPRPRPCRSWRWRRHPARAPM